MAQQQTQVVVTTQPINVAPVPQNQREWATGLFGCLEDCGGFCYGYFCYPCLVNRVAKKLGENCCIPLCCQGGTLALRTLVRNRYGIQGNLCDDYCITCCCGGLAVCQIDRELKRMGLE